MTRRLLVLLGGIALAVGLLPLSPAAADGWAPPLHTSRARLDAAVHCDAGARAGRHTVLLVPGTGATADEAWSWNYESRLPRAGLGVCTVDLPDRALGNFAVSAEYAVHAARTAYRVSGRKIAVLGHSQGGLMAMWIAKFWPDVAAHATDVIGLAANVRGTQLANTLCVSGACAPIAWQMARGSLVTDAATRAPLPATTSFTSIGSRTDEVVFPQPAVSTLRGGRTVMVQDVCPGRVVDHGLLLADAVGYALVVDALRRPGPARPARVPRSVCSSVTMPGTDPVGSAAFAETIVALSVGLLDVRGYTRAEVPLPAYAARWARR
jgi:triacylglycerol lipase